MRRRTLFAAALAGALALVTRDTRAQVAEQRYAVRRDGPARQSSWKPGAQRPQAPAWLYENGLTPEERAIAARQSCACSRTKGYR